MNSNLENFCPRLRPGRVIPQGSRIVFETDNPYNQIVLPMSLADLVLLCSGRFSIRQIIEKIYQKQGAVPFKSILRAIHALHQGGFFENGHELTLNSNLRSWMEPRESSWHVSWRFGQRILADRRSPLAFYGVTMILIVTSFLGMQDLPTHPLVVLHDLFTRSGFFEVMLRLFVCSSVLQTTRHLFRAIQLLLLTGKAYNVALRLSPWGLYLHVGDEAADLFENRLYTAMFHFSQIIVGWAGLFAFASILSPAWWQTLLFVNCVVTFWEINPFVNSEGLRLTQSLILPSEREIASWHFEASHVLKSINAGATRQDQDFARICAAWGSAWLLFSFAILLQLAASFGPTILGAIAQWQFNAVFALFGVAVWFLALYSVSQSFVETIVMSVMRPWWWKIKVNLSDKWRRRSADVDQAGIVSRLQELPLFSHFHEKHLLRILESSEVTDLSANTFVTHAGEPANELFILLEGEVLISFSSGAKKWETTFGPVSIFGESALLDVGALSMQVVTTAKSRIMEIPVKKIREIAQESHSIRELEDFRNAILVNQFFSSSPVFRSLSQTSIDYLSNRGALEYLDQGQVIFRQGDIGDCLYLIMRGSVDVHVHGMHVSRLGQGSFFGEIALIANIPRTATVCANEPSVFFRISADAFWEILVQNLDLGVFIETISENRLREDLEIASVAKRTGSAS